MKISKKAVLLAMSGIFTMMSLGLMLVFAENFSIIDLNVDPNNAIQHFKEVKIISTGANEDAYAIINKKGKLVGIDTVYNFVLTEQQQDLGGETKLVNQISRVSRGSTILGGTGNKIEKNNYNGILGGKENIIEAGHRNSILGGIVNAISGGNSSVIFGGRENVVTGSYSSIVGGEKNKVTKGYAIAVGNNDIANGYNSVAMGSGSKVQSENSFLWTDGKAQERLAVKGTFAVEGEKGMVINTTKAHSLAQLTVSGSLIVYDNEKALECTDDTKGVLKVINGDVYNNNQKCFCSCDGSGRNALHEGTRCESLCSNGTGLQAECGMVRVDCETTPYSYTGAGTSGACIIGELVEGTGAFLVDTHSDDTEWIHRSCQTSYGQVTGCQQQLTGESCPNLRTGHECIWDHEELTGHLITNPDLPRNSASFWKYDPELEGPCTYKCDQYGEWDSNQKKCIFHECRGDLPEGAKLNDEMALPLNDTTDYFYSDTSTGACSYKCNIEFGYYYSGTLNKCVTCPEGQTYDESDGTCKVACDMSNTSFETITIMDESGYAITIADRNLGATSNNTGEVSSYGCYFQRGNNYGFQPVGALETSMEFADTRGYGPGNPYSSHIFRVRASMSGDSTRVPVFGPNDDDWSSPANDNLWGGANDSSSNAFGVLDPDKENRRGPCPEGYHVPSIGERNDLLIMWYNKEYKADGVENLQYIKDSGKIANFRSGGISSLGKVESIELVEAFRDYFLLPPAGSRTFIDFAPGVTYGHGGSFWTSSSPWLSGSFSAGSLPLRSWIRDYPNVANSFDYNIESREGYVGHGTTGRKKSAQSVRCFKDVPECPSGKVWNQSELRCENRTDCDMEHTAIQDLELFLISSTGEISHFTMMDRNLGAFEVYNQKGENEQNARSLGCHFQWGNNNGFSLGAQSTRYGINSTTYTPSSYSNNKIYCKNRDGSTGDVSELDEDDLNEGGNILGSQYTPINYHLWGGGYILYNRVFRTGYGSDGSDVDRRGPCPEGYHVPRGIEMDDFVNNWNDASSSRGAIGKNFASDLLMPYGRYIEVYCGEQNRLKVGGGIWLSDHIYKYYTGDVTGGHYFNHIGKFTDNSAITFSRNGLAHGFPVRCIKNNMTTSPQKITIHSDGGTGAVIAIDWETEGTGKITALGTPTKNGIDFLGWYSSPSFAAEFKVNTGDYISNSGHLYARWDGCNIVDTAVQDLEVFFLSSPSRISHYVMMDRNLGATEAFNQDISSPNESSYGCYFQWGNNYPFNGGRNGSPSTTGTLTDTENYGPGRSKGYYYNSARYCVGGGGTGMYPYADRAGGIPLATRFWGGGWFDRYGEMYSGSIDGTDIDRQGPCPTGYHIPRGKEMENIMNDWKDVSNYNQSDSQSVKLEKSKIMASDLLLPFAGWNGEGCGNENHYLGKGMFGKYLISDYYKFEKNHLHIGETSDPDGIFLKGNGPAYGFSMRCVKNNISDTPQKVTINAYGGTGAVIAIDWETPENGRIVTLGEPKRAGYDFGGWYSNESLTTDIKVGDSISDRGDLYAKWIRDQEFEDLELYFLKDNGNITHYTMMDRNMGATEIYNQNFDNPNVESFGYHYQWGNNWGFKPCIALGSQCGTFPGGESYTTDERVQKSEWSLNTKSRYVSNVYREIVSSPFNWMADANAVANDESTDMWGGKGDTKTSNGAGTVSDRQGPCPDEYYVPSTLNWGNIIGSWKKSTPDTKDGIKMASDLLLPVAGARDYQSKYVQNQGSFGRYWSSSLRTDENSRAFSLRFASGDILPQQPLNISRGASVRCIKGVTNPQTITIHANGGIKAVIAIDGGKITALGTPTKNGTEFLGRYSDERFTNKVNTGDYISDGSHLYAKRNETVVQDLDVYILGETGDISRYMMMDRNLGATEIYNQNYSSPNKASYGYYYQWGNNYGFPTEGIVTTSDELVDASEYGPGNYYSSSTFSMGWNGSWDSSDNLNLWGDVTDTVEARQGPCPSGYHVPSRLEWKGLSDNWNKANTITNNEGYQVASDLLMPLAGCRIPEDGSFIGQGTIAHIWTSRHSHDEPGLAQQLAIGVHGILTTPGIEVSHGFSVRCFKNTINIEPLDIYADGGTGAVITIDWETEGSGKVTALGEPTKIGYKFEGWYLDTGFNNPINTGDYISNDGHLYAKWDELIAVFMEGSGFNNILSSLAGVKGNISNVKRADSIASGVITGLISDIDSPVPIIAWYDSGSIYYYSEANKIFLNENSQGMFESFSNLEQIDMSGWNTSNVINMAAMFSGCESLSTLDLNGFDTAKVTDMSYMFSNCSGLVNLVVSGWNTSNVTNMESIFRFCRNLTDLDVSNWNTSSVTTMKFMFQNCEKLEHLDVSEWKTSNVINMAGIFNQCQSLTTLDVSNWDTSNVIYMSDMFNHCTHLKSLDLSNFNTSKVTTMYDMFTDCYELTGLDLSSFDTSNVTRMDMMFQSCSNLKNVNLTSFNTSKVISMRNMFAGSASLTELDLSNFDTSNVTDMKGMFASCHDLRKLDISSFDTSKVTNMREMFRSNFALTGLDLRNFNTSKVTNMGRMFSGSLNLKVINVSSFDTSKVEVMSGMFGGCYELETIYASTGFVTTSVIDSDGMFEDDEKLVGGNGTRYTSSHVDDYYAKIDEPGQTGYLTEFRYTTLLPGNDFRSEMLRLAGSASNIKQILYTGNMPMGTVTGIVSVDGFEPVIAGYKNGIIYLTTDAIKIYLNEDASAMFSGLSMVTKIDTTKWDTIKTTDMSNMFKGCSSLEELDVSNRNTSNVANMSNMFEGCESLINLDVSKWNTKKVTDMSYLFSNCINLTGLNVREWNTSNVTSMRLMFGGRGQVYMKLENLDVSNWNTSKVTDMAGMFQNCNNLINLDVSRWNTSKVTDINHMFYDCYNLTNLDVSNWNTSNVTNMRTLFYECESLTGLDVSRWDTSNVTDMAFMFGGTEDHAMKLEKLDVSNWDTSNVTGMHSMFQECQSLTGLDVSKWDVGKVVDMNSIFNGCQSLTNLDVSNWNTKNVTNMYGAFDDCYNLTNLDVSNWNTSNVTDMGFMFGGTDDARVMKLTELDLSNWDTSNVTNMECMFQSCSNLKTIYASTGFVVDQVTNSDKMFYRDTMLVGGFGTKYIDTYRDKTYAKIDSESQSGYFTQLKATYLLPGQQFNQTLKRLAGQNSATYETSNTTIKQIKQWTGNNIPSGVTTGLISKNDSVYPAYAWFNNGTIYYYTKADRIYLNEDSSYMFNMLTGLINVEINEWNTSKVTNMKSMFYGCSNLTNLDVSNWNTFKVTNMSSMFENCYNLTNLDVSRWNTSNVSDMSRMFVDCSSLEELDVSNWNTSNVTTMFAVFGGNKNYMNLKHLDVSNWDTSKVTNMRSMFRNCIELTGLDVSKWNTSNVENMYMLFGAEYDYMNLEYLDVSNWDTSKVTNMRGTFRNCIKLTGLDVSNWNTSNVTNMRFMFASMAKNADALPTNLKYLDVSKWDTSSVTDMRDMFQNCVDLSGLDVSNWNTSNVIDMGFMFYGCSKLTKLDVSNWDTSDVTDMEAMFYGCSKLTELDLTNRKTNKVTNMSAMFHNNTNLKTIYASTGFVTTKVISDTGGASLFYGDTKLVGGFGTRYSSSRIHIEYAKIDSESQSGYFTQLKATYLLPGQQFNQTLKRLAGQNSATYNTSNTTIKQIKQWTGNNIPSGVTTGLISKNDSVYPAYAWFNNGTIYYYTKADRIYLDEDSSYMFNMLKNLKNIDMSEWNTNKVTNMEGVFGGCSSLIGVDLINWNTSNVTNMKGMFSGCSSLTELDISNFYTRNVTDMSSMFDSCNTLTQLNLEGIHTENVTNMQRMFYGCHSLTELDVSSFDISNVTNLSMMFENDSNLTSLDVSNWDTSKVSDMSRVFVDCSSLEELDVSNWNTSNVTTMYGLFAGDDNGMNLKYLDVSNFDTSKVTNMKGVFRNCVNLISIDVSKWKTSNVTDMSQMFYGNSGFIMNLEYVDVSNWDTSRVTDMSDMFQYCVNLVGLDVSNWDTSDVTDMEAMFNYCKKLTNLDVSKWDTSKVTNMEIMFGECSNLIELDLSNWNTSKVTNMDGMFLNNEKLKTIYASPLFVTTGVTDSTKMFIYDTKLVGGNGTEYSSSHTNKEYARIDQPGTPGYFTLKQ